MQRAMEAPSLKSSFWQHKRSMVPLLLLMLAILTHSQTLLLLRSMVHGMWGAARELLTGSTGSAPFLLLNFVIVTIIARSKSEYVANKHGHRACEDASVKPERKKKEEEEEEEAYKTPLVAEPMSFYLHEKRHASGQTSPMRNNVLLNDMKEFNATTEMEDEAPTKHEVPGSSPSSEEVWAAIIMARNHAKDDHQGHHKLYEQQHIMHHESETESRDQVKNEEEMEELNRRADKFIERFNLQMRLQRQESLQRRCTQISEPPPYYWPPPIPTCNMVEV